MWFLKQKNKQFIFILLALFLLLLPIIFPLLQKGFFISDDGEWMIIRFSAFYEMIRGGEFPVRFLQRLNNGFGYPVANFLYPGYLYLGVPIHVLGFSFIDTIKILMGSSMVFSVVFCYFWLRKFFGAFAAFFGSLFYGYAPYHLFDLYKRGSLGELLALAVIPFVLWQVERKSVFWSALGLGFLLLSHNTLSLFFFVLLILYMLLNVAIATHKKKLALYYGLICSVGIGSSAFFWIPAIYDLQYTVFATKSIANWSSYFSGVQLVGVQTYLAFALALLLFLKGKVKAASHRLTLFFLFLGLLGMFLATSGSGILWKNLPVSFVQFPFRFLSITILAGAFITAFLFSEFSKKQQVVGAGVLTVLSVVSLWQSVSAVEYTEKGDSYYATNMDTTTVQQEYMPIWVKEHPTKWQPEKVITDGGNLTSLTVRPGNFSFQTEGKNSAIYVVQSIYFPGWLAKIDGERSTIAYKNPQGLIEVPVPAGKHTVSVTFSETPVRLFADIVSIVSVLSLIVVIVVGKQKKIK